MFALPLAAPAPALGGSTALLNAPSTQPRAPSCNAAPLSIEIPAGQRARRRRRPAPPPSALPGALSQALGSLAEALDSGVARVRTTLSPPPPGFPSGPAGDSAVALLNDPLAFLEAAQQDHGDVVGLLLAGQRAVLVTDPEVARHVLVDAPEVYVKAGTAFFPGSSLAGNGLLVSDGAAWRRQRQLAAPAFRRAAVDAYAAAMCSCTEAALADRRRWRGGVVRDVYADFNDLTLAITMQALFGAGVRAADAKEVTGSIRAAFEFFARRSADAFALPEWVPTPDNLRFAAAVSRLDAAVYGLIADRRRELAQQQSLQPPATLSSSAAVPTTTGSAHASAIDLGAAQAPRDLLDALLLSRDAEGQGMPDVALRDELMTLLVAGQETSAILLAWACAELAAAPAAQAAAAAEVGEVLRGRGPTAADARGGLPYLEAVILETLRLRPPAYIVGRCCCVDGAELAGAALPAGTTVLVSPYVMHRDRRRWGPDALEFRPERWLERGSEKGAPMAAAALAGMGPNGSYIPFGAGQRNCIGTGFAMMEAVLVLAAVLQRYCLEPPRGAPPPRPQPRITLRPESVRLALRRRPVAAAEEEEDTPVEKAPAHSERPAEAAAAR